MRPMLALTVAAFSLVGCTSSAPGARGSSTGNAKKPVASPVSAAPSAKSQAVPSTSVQALPASGPERPGPASSPVQSAQAAARRPADLVRCEAHLDAVFGRWTPSVDEVVTAIDALPEKTCLALATREAAVRSCAAEAKTSLVLISTDDLNGPSGCELQIGAAEANGRKWISFFAFYRSSGAQFDGGARVVELTSARPKLYLDALGKHGSLCPTTGGNPLKPNELPDGWAAHPQPLKDFLCGASK